MTVPFSPVQDVAVHQTVCSDGPDLGHGGHLVAGRKLRALVSVSLTMIFPSFFFILFLPNCLFFCSVSPSVTPPGIDFGQSAFVVEMHLLDHDRRRLMG